MRKFYNKNFEDVHSVCRILLNCAMPSALHPCAGWKKSSKTSSVIGRGIVFKNCLDQLGTIGGDLIGRTILCDRQGRSEAITCISICTGLPRRLEKLRRRKQKSEAHAGHCGNQQTDTGLVFPSSGSVSPPKPKRPANIFTDFRKRAIDKGSRDTFCLSLNRQVVQPNIDPAQRQLTQLVRNLGSCDSFNQNSQADPIAHQFQAHVPLPGRW